MSTMDLFEDGFPHSTREGYERGCRGSACLGKLEHGFSCSEAAVRYAGDYGYRKRVEAGMTPAEIAEADAVERSAAAPAPKAKRKAAPVVEAAADPVGRALVAAAVEQAEAERGEVRDEVAAAPKRRATPEIVHGTNAGYQRGCRRDEDCPGDVDGLTCRGAYRAYQRDYSARRRAGGGVPLGSTKGQPRGTRIQPAEVVAVAPVEEALPPSRVVLTPTLDELQADVAARDARIAVLEEQLVAARAAAWSTVVEQVGPGAVTLRIEVLGVAS